MTFKGMRQDKINKYHSWFQVSRKLRGILYSYTDRDNTQEIVDALFTSLNKPKKRTSLSEKSCQICNDINPTWFTSNKLWNLVVKNKYHFLCPNCFIKKATNKGIEVAWELSVEQGSDVVDIGSHNVTEDIESRNNREVQANE